MVCLLLSGGSGKRLWPLSNEKTAKQFIKILKDEQGESISMLQRNFRQVMKGIPDAVVYAVSNEQQKSIIESQLMGQVNVIVEPERRNTFPAIALATLYLRHVKGFPDNETIVVLPVDQYVDDAFHRILMSAEKVLETRKADLVLIGIMPDYPATKYGYILPARDSINKSLGQRVKMFKEKPDEETAISLIAEGALWNAGVFCFKIGWLLRILEESIGITEYPALLEKYSDLESNSFDRVVVEKTANIYTVSYHGEWMDLGTWNSLVTKLEGSIGDNVVFDDTSTNTYIVNSTQKKVVVVGLKNSVVVVTDDGVLVSDLEASERLQDYLE